MAVADDRGPVVPPFSLAVAVADDRGPVGPPRPPRSPWTMPRRLLPARPAHRGRLPRHQGPRALDEEAWTLAQSRAPVRRRRQIPPHRSASPPAGATPRRDAAGSISLSPPLLSSTRPPSRPRPRPTRRPRSPSAHARVPHLGRRSWRPRRRWARSSIIGERLGFVSVQGTADGAGGAVGRTFYTAGQSICAGPQGCRRPDTTTSSDVKVALVPTPTPHFRTGGSRSSSDGVGINSQERLTLREG
ncbi:probable ribonuclease ZC3H12D isoform X2 [Triticum dicoccoides]|uniref:probable ribonuclease ZC3H12D isoform X2 n=1 Tax=Triticum dicoccoides TaxID=85692 RepID=UPI001890AF98|nr:probable ribonuclease ZC3H12D isoform X2 [Triticum dicoccoides]